MLSNYFLAGGFGMVPVLVVGVGTLLLALHTTYRPDERRIELARALGVSLIFFSVTGLIANAAATFLYVAQNVEAAERLPTLCLGLYESTAPGTIGFGLLALIHLALAFAAPRTAIA